MDWPTLLIIPAAILGAPYTLGPVALRRAVRMSADYSLEEIDQSLAPAHARALWDDADGPLRHQGFEPGPRLLLSGFTPGIDLYVAAYAHRPNRDLAMAAAALRRSGERTAPGAAYVEFTADMSDGSSVSVSNSPTPPFEPPGMGRILLRFPRERDPARLYALHRAAASRYGHPPRSPVPDGEWWSAAVRDAADRYLARAEAARYARRVEGFEYALTWKGACMGAWLGLPPASWARARWKGRRERELLRFCPASQGRPSLRSSPR